MSDAHTSESTLYASLGASTSKKGILEAVGELGRAEYFCKPLPDITGDPSYYSFLHADGVGTKSILAYLLYKESGDPQYFRSLAQDSVVMNLDDLACVGAFESLTLSNSIGRNSRLISDAVVAEIIAGYEETLDLLNQSEIVIGFGGGETADLNDLVRTVVIDSTLIGRVARDSVIKTTNITEGDIIVGLSSTGRASFEKRDNHGLGSNGFTLVRHALIAPHYAEKYPDIFDSATASIQSFKGSCGLLDYLPELGMSLGEAVLSPTRPFAPIVQKAHKLLGKDLHACIHCSGGGQSKVLRFLKDLRCVKDNLFPTPVINKLIQNAAKVPWSEMYTVFNMGHRMELYCPENRFEELKEIAAAFNIEAKVIGKVESSTEGAQVLICSENGEFLYKS